MKTVTKRRQEDGVVTKNIDRILETQQNFYKKIFYTKAKTGIKVQNVFLNSLKKKLSNAK